VKSPDEALKRRPQPAVFATYIGFLINCYAADALHMAIAPVSDQTDAFSNDPWMQNFQVTTCSRLKG
jgi:hypothetical protein